MATRQGIMLAKPFAANLLKKMPKQIIVQPKIDGDRLRATPTPSGYRLYSSSAALVNSIPHINEVLDKAFGHWRLDERPTIDGEAYSKDLPQQTIGAIVRKTTRLDPDYRSVEFWAFDLISERSQINRINDLMRLNLSEWAGLKTLTSTLISQDEWPSFLKAFTNEGYEGIILRNPESTYQLGKQSCILKFKPEKHDCYQIHGVHEAIAKTGARKGILGAVVVHDQHGNRFQIGAGALDHDQRYYYWQNPPLGKFAKIKYTRRTNAGIPREAVLLEIVDNMEEPDAQGLHSK